jgi:other hect domain ubiquitin protein ligase E3
LEQEQEKKEEKINEEENAKEESKEKIERRKLNKKCQSIMKQKFDLNAVEGKLEEKNYEKFNVIAYIIESFLKEDTTEEVKELFSSLHISKARAKKLIPVPVSALPKPDPSLFAAVQPAKIDVPVEVPKEEVIKKEENLEVEAEEEDEDDELMAALRLSMGDAEQVTEPEAVTESVAEVKVDAPSETVAESKEIIKEEPEDEDVSVQGHITQEDLMQIYLYCVEHVPVRVVDELFEFGYDLHLLPNHYLTLQEAIDSELRNIEKDSHLAYYTQLVQYIEAIFNDTQGLTSPLELLASHVIPFSSDSEIHCQTYPLLVDVDCRVLRQGFEVLKQFNALFKLNVSYINLDGTSRISNNLFKHRHLIFHSVKMTTFYDILEKTPSVEGNQPTVTLDRKAIEAAREAAKKNNEPLTEDWYLKNTAFGVAFSQLQKTNPNVYRQPRPASSSNPHYSVLLNFEGELVEGIRGPYRQFFTDVSKELEDIKPLLPLIIPCPNAVSSLGKNQDKFVLCSSSNQKSHLELFKFLGQMMAMAIRTSVVLPLGLHTGVWKRLVGFPAERQDLIDQDELFYKLLVILSTISKEEFDTLEDQDLTFTVRLSDMSVRLLKPDGDKIPITYENKDEWIRLALQVRLNESNLQLEHILSGISDVIPLPLLSLLTPQDLEWSVSGKPVIDINLLKRHTKLNVAFTENTPVIRYFWQVLHSLTQEERIKFIRFVYAQERLPVDDQEFIRTGTKMYIKPYSGKSSTPDKCFPRSDTCFFSINLPNYSSPEILKEKLLTAILYASDSMNADDPQGGLPTNF